MSENKKDGRKSRRTALGAVGGVIVALVAGYFGVDAATGGDDSSDDSRAFSAMSPTGDDCAVDTLPTQADEVIDAVLDGGPFTHGTDDGKHFGNYEGVLPEENSSYYREYTVDTPGINHRGTRRIVVGGGSATDPDVWYYTDDHYESFCSIPDAED
ncbi:ribonuclease domain-containing protein [uncultured Corynebacterium sp.]|uniref:ribonuclease domain-containing protein n=1 Tax=uncultured Corynebacterium sp. TaxID=159447 RepID=UPI0025F00CC3|nr:ribonuclease domain-containing protein [uncultured Corynebacterium sp.]